jgi:hypothetical protein
MFGLLACSDSNIDVMGFSLMIVITDRGGLVNFCIILGGGGRDIKVRKPLSQIFHSFASSNSPLQFLYLWFI